MIHDLRTAVRAIRCNKLFALNALLAFSFGIGATVTVFSVIDAVLLRPASFPDPESVVVVQASDKSGHWDAVAPWIYERIRSERNVFSSVASFRTALFTVRRI